VSNVGPVSETPSGLKGMLGLLGRPGGDDFFFPPADRVLGGFGRLRGSSAGQNLFNAGVDGPFADSSDGGDPRDADGDALVQGGGGELHAPIPDFDGELRVASFVELAGSNISPIGGDDPVVKGINGPADGPGDSKGGPGGPSGPGGLPPGIDDPSDVRDGVEDIAAVPEPGTLLLLGSALAGAALLRRRASSGRP
jgi:hypothetical protein